jgi:hypothetical protein
MHGIVTATYLLLTKQYRAPYQSGFKYNMTPYEIKKNKVAPHSKIE